VLLRKVWSWVFDGGHGLRDLRTDVGEGAKDPWLLSLPFCIFRTDESFKPLSRPPRDYADEEFSSVSVASTCDGSTPKITTSASWTAFKLSARKMSSFPDSVCSGKRSDNRCSDATLCTHAMNLLNAAGESLGAFMRDFRIGVPRLP
jgi:hypothetical protein